MRYTLFKSVLIFISVVFSGLSALSQAAFADNIGVYAELPRTASVRVSPDGKYLAMLSPHKDNKAIFVYNLQDPNAKITVIPSPRNSLVKSVTWGSDKHIIMRGQSRHFLGDGGKLRKYSVLHYRWYSTNVETQRTEMLFRDKIEDEQRSYQVVNGGNFAHRLPEDPSHILMSYSEFTNRPVTKYWRVNLDSGKSRQIKTLPFDTSRVIRSKDGLEILGRSDYDPKRGLFKIFSGEYPDEKEIYSEQFDTSENPTTRLQTKSNGKFVISRDTGAGFEWVSLDPSTGAEMPFSIDLDIPDAYEYRPIFDPYNRDLIGASYMDDLEKEVYFAEPFKSWHSKISRALKGQSVSILSWTGDKSMVTVYAENAENAGEFYLFEPNVGQISPLGGTYPEISASEIGKTKRINYAARDGLQIPAYLTFPPSKTEANGPFSLVVLPHGGPAARDDASFDFWAQYIASQGYLVFKPQFRGSTGFGYDFAKKGEGEFGDGMLKDTIDGVNYLINQGLVNRDKICVTGASYGGYQALALPMIEPDMFKCAISVNGVSDLPKMIDYEIAYGGREGGAKKYWDVMMGVADGGEEKLSRQSPADNAERIKAEIMLIHGEDDATVPLQQAQEMQKALRKIGRKVDIITLKDDDHNLSLPQSRKKLLEESRDFFAKHLK